MHTEHSKIFEYIIRDQPSEIRLQVYLHYNNQRSVCRCTCTTTIRDPSAGMPALEPSEIRLQVHLHYNHQRSVCRYTCTTAIRDPSAGIPALQPSEIRLQVYLHYKQQRSVCMYTCTTTIRDPSAGIPALQPRKWVLFDHPIIYLMYIHLVFETIGRTVKESSWTIQFPCQ